MISRIETPQTDILRRATERRDMARMEFDRWNEVVKGIEEIVGRGNGEVVDDPAQHPRFRPAPKSSEGGVIAATATAAASVIIKQGRPMPTRALYNALTVLGVVIGGADPVATLSARLSRSSTLENSRPFGWRLREPGQTNEAADPPASDESAASDPTNNQHHEGDAGGGG